MRFSFFCEIVTSRSQNFQCHHFQVHSSVALRTSTRFGKHHHHPRKVCRLPPLKPRPQQTPRLLSLLNTWRLPLHFPFLISRLCTAPDVKLLSICSSVYRADISFLNLSFKHCIVFSHLGSYPDCLHLLAIGNTSVRSDVLSKV